MDVPDNKVRLHQVKSCNLGKLGRDGVALKINFAMASREGKTEPDQSAEFGLTHDLARGLAQALTKLLQDTATTPKPN